MPNTPHSYMPSTLDTHYTKLHRVAITGIGAISVLGNGIDAIEESLKAGRSGICIDPDRENNGFRSALTGMLQPPDLRGIANRKQRKTMTDYCLHALESARQAIEMSGLEKSQINHPATGIIFGNDSSTLAAVEQTDIVREHKATSSIDSGYIFKAMTSNITMNLCSVLETKGICYTISSACSSSGHAVGQAAQLIRLGQQERIICGGAQEINWQSMCSFDALGAFSTRTDAPEQASRPFDRSRDGLVPSGGAAAIVLESFESARARNATILGEILAYGFSTDAEFLAVPSDTGLSRAMEHALSQTTLGLGDIDFINAHATSTGAGDSAEAKNILNLYKADNCPPVASSKSMTGHELWMSGAAQVVYSTLMARSGFIAPNINFEKSDDDSKRLNIVTETRD